MHPEASGHLSLRESRRRGTACLSQLCWPPWADAQSWVLMPRLRKQDAQGSDLDLEGSQHGCCCCHQAGGPVRTATSGRCCNGWTQAACLRSRLRPVRKVWSHYLLAPPLSPWRCSPQKRSGEQVTRKTQTESSCRAAAQCQASLPDRAVQQEETHLEPASSPWQKLGSGWLVD